MPRHKPTVVKGLRLTDEDRHLFQCAANLANEELMEWLRKIARKEAKKALLNQHPNPQVDCDYD